MVERHIPQSQASQKWDLDGDGVLDDAELALKNMAAGDDELDMRKIHELMSEHLQTQKSLWKFKRIAASFFVIIIVLALSNLATSFAAAYLSKDTKASGGDLQGLDGNTLGMQTTAEHTEAFTLDTEDAVESFLELDVEQGKLMVIECKADRTVHMSRTFKDGRITDYAFCPLPTGHKAAYDFRNPELPSVEISTLTGPVIIAPDSDGSFYTITGTGVTSHAGFPCDDAIDCDPGLVCDSETKSCASIMP
eukprot:CAMPEP_0113389676 /NCGR_PEP_ID=MMETSP0013_2-20120614/9753_1 /TAXON_ID=2843 ORGANISM="Skeletonema costatum, Strain 1716" /NCGR_SAMPLE_ID=MMETSP0013_2 /ASSEMBLY_ACC=CAM_ASM_000158 /LENGTH=249 /DNA_ID=CAMNT_0000272767 /DNA_START=83 /DNA_END=832 /DNA_ORIENTATION=+ /assembly_acc=CAM_ASM_000158